MKEMLHWLRLRHPAPLLSLSPLGHDFIPQGANVDTHRECLLARADWPPSSCSIVLVLVALCWLGAAHS